ncbi:MAG: radical SAM protein, partial [Verrucomicrobia bacterium]|nr:radical SAM protein [Verrucomicrobiota bacterium]
AESASGLSEPALEHLSPQCCLPQIRERLHADPTHCLALWLACSVDEPWQEVLGSRMQELRSFSGICDVCLAAVPAELEREGDDVYCAKYCPTHGTRRWLVSRNGDRYLRFDRQYHTLFPADEPPSAGGEPYFLITNRCNQGCNYCAFEPNRYDYFGDYDVEQFDRDMRSSRSSKIDLFGGEPLMHPRFFEFVERIAAAGKTTVILSNGMGFADEGVVLRLMEASRGRCFVRITFEGFEDENYGHLRVRRLIDLKLAALANLKKHAVPTALAHTVNLDEQRDEDRLRRTIRAIIEFAMKERFVSGVSFTSVTALGASRNNRPDEVLSVDRLMDRLLAACLVAIERNHVYLTQQIALYVGRILDVPMCEYKQAAMLFRRGGRWVGINDLFDCQRLERRFDRRIEQPRVGRFRQLLGLVADLAASARLSRLLWLAGLAGRMLPLLWSGLDYRKIPKEILLLNVSTTCDPNNFDASVARRCERPTYSVSDTGVRTRLGAHLLIDFLRERTAADQPRNGKEAAVRKKGFPKSQI